MIKSVSQPTSKHKIVALSYSLTSFLGDATRPAVIYVCVGSQVMVVFRERQRRRQNFCEDVLFFIQEHLQSKKQLAQSPR